MHTRFSVYFGPRPPPDGWKPSGIKPTKKTVAEHIRISKYIIRNINSRDLLFYIIFIHSRYQTMKSLRFLFVGSVFNPINFKSHKKTNFPRHLRSTFVRFRRLPQFPTQPGRPTGIRPDIGRSGVHGDSARRMGYATSGRRPYHLQMRQMVRTGHGMPG